MRRTRLAFLGRDVARVALGTAGFGTAQDERAAFDILDAYAGQGGNLVDTARIYGDVMNEKFGQSEEIVGRWMRANGCRKDMVVATKGGHPRIRTMDRGRLDAASLTEDIEDSLAALETDYVDIYYLHRDDAARDVADIMETLNGFVRKGMTRALGASNWSACRIMEANAYAVSRGLTPFSANEPQWSLAKMMIVEDPTLRTMDDEMLDMHKKTGMLCMPFTSQAKGFFSKLHDGGQESLSDKAKRRYLSEGNLRLYGILEDVSRRSGISVSAAALAYLINRPFPVCPVAGVSSVAQALLLGEAADATMTPEDIRLLDA